MVVAEAKPLIVLGVAFAGITCFNCIIVESFAPTVTVLASTISSINNSKVPLDDAVLATTISVTTVVVDVVGTVYRVVLDVDAAPRKSVLVVVAISYYLP